MGSASRISLASLTPNNIGAVRKLNAVLFPVKYSEKFYQQILTPELDEFCKLAYYNDIPVGTICCRIEQRDGQCALYIMTMGVLAPYRSRTIGSEMLSAIISAAQSDSNPVKIHNIFLHVQTNNGDAKSFYERHGFTESGVQEDYYKKISPHTAWILERAMS